MRAIWKYPVSAGAFELEMPADAAVLSVQTQGQEPVMWALVDPQASKQIRHFITLPTGGEVPDGCGRFVGTFQLMGGALVFHLCELQRLPGVADLVPVITHSP